MIERPQIDGHILFVKVLRLFAERHEHEVPTIQAIRTAVGHHVSGEPQAIFWWMGEEVTCAPTVNTRDRLGWRLGWSRFVLILVVAHVSIQPVHASSSCNA